MKIEYDPAKAQANLIKHGVDFSKIAQFNWGTADITWDDRFDYGENRFAAQGYIGGRLHILIYTIRDDTLRIISLRKSNARERRAYAKKTKPYFPGGLG